MKWCIAIAVLIAGFYLPARAELADGINAIVNNKVITYQEVREYSGPAVDVLQRQYADQPDLFQQKLNDTLRDGMETLIENQLILHEFDSKYNPLPDSAVDQIVAEHIRDRFGDRITCIKTLQAQGITFEKFREDIREQYIISQLRYRNLSDEKVILSPYKIENYYMLHQDDFKVGEQVKLRMIVLNKSSDADTYTRRRADEILTEIKKGTSFEQLASLYSQDTQQRGNDWIETSVLRKELADAVTTLKPGDTSAVIETPDNCYIVHVLDKRTAHVKPINDVREDIEKALRTQEQKEAQQRWIESLKKKAFIRIFG